MTIVYSLGRYKETIVCISVARERNICQTCLNDMKYGLPVGVRDQLLAQQAASQELVTVPKSDIGTRYFYENQSQMSEYTGVGSASESIPDAMRHAAESRQLDIFAQARQKIEARSSTAFRNLPKLCSFWVHGQCTRVAKKSCPFRPCCGTYIFPEIAGSNKDMCTELVKSLNSKVWVVIIVWYLNEGM